MKNQILLRSIRGGLVEREHYGLIVLVGKQKKVLTGFGDIGKSFFYTRSCHKPFQALPIILSKAYEYYDFTIEELAVCAGSHSGSSVHTALVENILKKVGLNKSYLQCGAHQPLDEEAKNSLIRNGQNPTALHNNCSGKHAGMLAVCHKNNWDLKNYLDINHPIQQEILKITKKYCEIDEFPLSVDGCGTPVPAMPLSNLALGYLNLFSSQEASLLKQAFLGNSFIIGGTKRLDTEIIEASGGKLVAKVGAEGLCVIYNPDLKQALAVKIMDASMSARKIVVFEMLKKLNWIEKEQINHYCDLSVKTLKGEDVGYLEVVF